MLLQSVGILGIGLVWGWLLGKVWRKRHRPWRFSISVITASSAVGSVVFAYSSWAGVALFLGAAFVAFLLHLAWLDELRRKLVRRFDS